MPVSPARRRECPHSPGARKRIGAGKFQHFGIWPTATDFLATSNAKPFFAAERFRDVVEPFALSLNRYIAPLASGLDGKPQCLLRFRLRHLLGCTRATSPGPAKMVMVRVAASIVVLTFVFSCTAMVGSSLAGNSQTPKSNAEVDFDIAAQSLASALLAYSEATGLEIYYSAALAENRRSSGVAGRLLPLAALQILLRSTGYAAKISAPGALTIVLAPPQPSPALASLATRKQLEPYFATLQGRISEILCRNSELSSTARELLLQLWLAPSGVVAQADIIDDKGGRTDDQAPAAAIRGIALAPPPAGMPEPVNLVIFPTSDSSTCAAAASQRRAG